MDNASYHKSKPTSTPKPHKMRKDDIVTAMHDYGLAVCSDMTRAELQLILSSYIRSNVQPEVVQKSELAGHTVLFTPPHYSDLQPIELLWASIKTKVGLKYTTGTTMHDVRSRLNSAFTDLDSLEGSTLIEKIIRHVDSFLHSIEQEISQDDSTAGNGADLLDDLAEDGGDFEHSVSDGHTDTDSE